MFYGFMRLIFYAVWAYIIYSVYRFFRNVWRRVAPPAAKPEPRRVSGVMVKDEACGTYIPQDDALRETVGGKEYFFCSKECRKKFLDASKKAR
jgi:YHS domain-containing protein